jgi:hypothetical protein
MDGVEDPIGQQPGLRDRGESHVPIVAQIFNLKKGLR